MRNRNTIALLALSLALLGCAGTMPDVKVARASHGAADDARPELEKGRMLFGRGEYALALEAFRKAVRAAPDDADGYNGLAASYDAIGRFDLSGRYFELALAIAPNDGRIRRNMARSFERQGRPAEARALLAEVEATAQVDALAAIAPAPLSVPAEVLVGGDSVTFKVAEMPLVPLPKRAVADPAAPRMAAKVRLERASMSETVLVTRVERRPPRPVAPRAFGFSFGKPSTPKARASFSIDLAPPARTSAKPELALRVLNAVGRRGQAARMRTHLSGQGWRPIETGDAAQRLSQSRVISPLSEQAAARRLAAKLPFKAPVYASRGADRIVLLLGANAVRFDERLRMVATR